jgi:high-affinity iron transporter
VLANYLVGLREGLEASLVVVILVAHLVRTGRRHLLPKVWAGVGTAVAASLGFGALLTFGPRGLTFEAQETIGGALSIVAVGFVTWMVLWMASAARGLSAQLKGRADTAAKVGGGGLVVLAMVAVGREGLETALFLWAATRAVAGESGSAAVPLVGALLGLVTAVVVGWAVYRGALRLNLARFFAWTGGFLIFVAAGVLAYGAHDLQEAGVLPGLNTMAYDISDVIAPSTVVATVVKGVFNIAPIATALEAGVWGAYVAVVLPLFVRRLRAAGAPSRPVPAAGRAASTVPGASA